MKSSVASVRLWFWSCFLVALLAAGYFHSQRWRQEAQHRDVEMVLDFNSLVELSRARGQSWQAVLPEFTQYGVTGLAFAELRLDELEGYGVFNCYSGSELASNEGVGMGPTPLLNPQFSYVVQWGGSALLSVEQLEQVLRNAFGATKVKRWSASQGRLQGKTIFEVQLPFKSIQSSGVCFPDWAIAECESRKLQVWLRPENRAPADAAGVKAYLARLKSQYKVEGLVFGGSANEVVGYPEALEDTARFIEESGWKLGFIELPKATQQKGIETLVRALPRATVRVFAVPPQQQATAKPPRVIQMYSLAARERNLTLLYLRPYAWDPTPDKGFEDANNRLFAGVYEDLRDRVGAGKEAAAFTHEVVVPAWGVALLSLAGVAAVGLAVSCYVRFSLALAVGGVVAFAGLNVLMALTPVAHIWLALMALGTACSCSLLAVVWNFSGLRGAAQQGSWLAMMLKATRSWLGMCFISLAGALLASCFLQDTSYKLGLDIFRGVKVLTVIVPVLIVGCWMLSSDERRHWLQIGGSSLKLYQLIALAVLAVGGLVYTMRTGNMAGTDVSGDAMEKERYLRMVLDQLLGVRPRFKEFLLAHPAMLCVPLLLRWGWREATAVMVLVGATGQVGLADTFAHIHTPLYISLVRCVLGVFLGGILGWVYAGVLALAAKAFSRVKTSTLFSTGISQ